MQAIAAHDNPLSTLALCHDGSRVATTSERGDRACSLNYMRVVIGYVNRLGIMECYGEGSQIRVEHHASIDISLSVSFIVRIPNMICAYNMCPL